MLLNDEEYMKVRNMALTISEKRNIMQWSVQTMPL